MMLVDLIGAALTLLTVALLGLGGALAALRLLGAEARRDTLAFAIASLLAMIAEAVAIALVLGALGQLRLAWALAIQTVLVILLLRGWGRDGVNADQELGALLRPLAGRVWRRAREHPALTLLALHGIGSEALRGLLRPPLSWDSLMYHLYLTATWLQTHNLLPVLGAYPLSDFGYVPANGSLWTWWWMAPSHGELYVNLAELPAWLLLGLAVGAIARELGARRLWPLPAFVVLLLPTVLRLVATEYVDDLQAAVFLAAVFFTVRWFAAPRAGFATLVGMGCGVACGTKILGVPYVAAWAAAAVLGAGWGGGQWRRRLPQLGLALLLTVALGTFFYLRNIALGAGPLALACEAIDRPGVIVPHFPRPDSVWARARRAPGSEALELTDAFLGVTRAPSLELGIGPPVLLIALLAALFPFVLAPPRRLALVIASQIAFEAVFWTLFPYASSSSVYANVRYLIAAVGLALAGGVALGEQRGIRDRWLELIAIACACQGLIELHAEMPLAVRLAFALADVLAVALILSASFRAWVKGQAPRLVIAGLVAGVLAAPMLGQFRRADRARAFATELTLHSTTAPIYAAAWKWLDDNAADGTTAVDGSVFVYPAMGPDLERRAIFVNVNRANFDVAAHYPDCNVRSDPSPAAWIDNLRAAGVRWVLLSRSPLIAFPPELSWVLQHPELFAVRYRDPANVIFEFQPATPAAGP